MTSDPSDHRRDEPARASTLDRRSFLGPVLAAGASVAPAMLSGRLRAQSQTTDVVARTAHGRVRGARKDGVLGRAAALAADRTDDVESVTGCRLSPA